MAEQIFGLFIDPPIAIARLGSSTNPVDAYEWVEAQVPRYDGETTIAPAWSLSVEIDGSVRPHLPTAISFRDGDRIRPLAPFFEIWALTGAAGSSQASWTAQPLTVALLASVGLKPEALTLSVVAANRKAARRAAKSDLAFGTQEPLRIMANDHLRHQLLGKSPKYAVDPMIPEGRGIPLGHVQMIRSSKNIAGQPWSDAVNLETLRFRFWPASGEFYGPPQAVTPDASRNRPFGAVKPENGFLNPRAGWFEASTSLTLSPADTYDVVNQDTDNTGPSLGVVDDTCEVHFKVTLDIATGNAIDASAVTFVAPPDFAPDRRPFLSLADELNDRQASAKDRNAALTDEQLDRWIEDFFERVYETASLLNVDAWRALGRRARRAAPVTESDLLEKDIDEGARLLPEFALGGRDPLRNPSYKISGPTPNDPLPLTRHTRMRHRALSDLQELERVVALSPNRIENLVRPPFYLGENESATVTSMQMPPLMRQSNALPLSIAAWQYDLVMRWAKKAASGAAFALVLAPPTDKPLSEGAYRRLQRVLASLPDKV